MTVLEVTSTLTKLDAQITATQAGEFVASDGLHYATSIVCDPGELETIREAWQQLADEAADPNPFYEPWFFLPAASHLSAGEQWQILLVHRSAPKHPGKPTLCGFFPFVKSRGLGGLSQLTLWKNQFCFITNPLLHRDAHADTFRAVFQHLRSRDTDVSSVEMSMLAGDGPLHHGITELLRETLSTTFIPDHYLRASVTCEGNADDYLKQALGGHHVREYRRKRRKLEALGQLEYRQLTEIRAVDCWIDWFLTLEAEGWKARAGTAIQLHAGESAFFREMVVSGFQLGKVRMEGLFLNGEPIALKLNLFSHPAMFAFKIAFDETYHHCSPGVQLEFESLQRLCADPAVKWADSCAAPGHQMIDRLWMERRIIRHLIISTGNYSGDFVLGAMPLLRSINRVRKRWLEQFKSKTAGTDSSKRHP